MDPGTALTAAVIAELAFKKFIESGAGELAKKFTEAAIGKMDELRQKIRDRLWGDSEAQQAILSIEEKQTLDLAIVVQHLRNVMADDPQFAEEIRQLAGQVMHGDSSAAGRNIQNVSGGQGTQINDATAPILNNVANSPITFIYNSPPNP